MTDSTARAQRFDTESSPAPAYLWAPPQKPVSVSIPLTVIDQLEREAVESFRSLSSRGSEIGGLLFGNVIPGAPLTVAVEAYQAIECDYSGGPLYHLTAGEIARLDRAIEQRLASGPHAVGFYRSHTRKGLSLDPEDLALFESHFTEPHHVALLIRPAATKVSVAGIFIREDGQVHGEATCLEFPFRSSQHDGARRPETLYEGAVAGPRSVSAAAAPPKPAIRAQIVPIASRRETVPEAPHPMPIQASPEPPEMPAPAAPAPPPVVAAAPVLEPEAAPAPVKSAPPPPPVTSTAVATVSEPIAAEPRKRSSKLLWIGLGAAVSVILSVGFILSSGILHRGGAIPTAPQDTSALALRVDRNGADIVLTWNRDAAAIKQASKAVLSIVDGAQNENVDMDLAQLRNGSIVYSPVTSDVVFRMEVSGADQLKTVSESVRVLRTRPSPMPETPAQQPASQLPQQAQGAKPNVPAAPATADAAAPAAEEEKPVALAQAMKPFHAESLAQRLRPSSPAELPEAPLGAPTAGPAPSVSLGNIVSSQQALPAPPSATSAPASSSPVPAEKKVSSGGQIQQAQLIRRRDPEYPKLARDAGASGVVELLATVGADGKVKSVQVVRGHPLLRQAATDAVKGWVYRPTLLNGVPVETQTQVILNFKAER
jgi:protein TonB